MSSVAAEHLATARTASGQTLASLARDRNNNFNLIRCTLALMVLIHHAFELTGNPVEPSNLAARGLSNFGEIGVNGFFIVSGFLVTRSLLGRATLKAFVLARVLRIFPGLWVMLIVTTLALSLLSSLGPATYLQHPGTWTYAARNATAMLITFPLPGVFTDNPATVAANGSLWSLKYEMLCYLSLAFAGALGLAQRRWPLAAVAAFCAVALILLPGEVNYFFDLMRRLGLCFTLGSTAAAFADKVPMRLSVVAVLVLLALLCDRTALSPVTWTLAYGYSLLWFAYVPKGVLLAFNRLPDLSYGLYIYAFPIQQALIATGIGAAAFTNMGLALPATLICAALSWYIIEKPALELKETLGRRRDPRVAEQQA